MSQVCEYFIKIIFMHPIFFTRATHCEHILYNAGIGIVKYKFIGTTECIGIFSQNCTDLKSYLEFLSCFNIHFYFYFFVLFFSRKLKFFEFLVSKLINFVCVCVSLCSLCVYVYIHIFLNCILQY